jgi:hypothetical protein
MDCGHLTVRTPELDDRSRGEIVYWCATCQRHIVSRPLTRGDLVVFFGSLAGVTVTLTWAVWLVLR